MTDEAYIANIKKMTLLELLDEIMMTPGLLSDPYYKEFRAAIYERYEELIKEQAK
jgi:hypothetical protein